MMPFPEGWSQGNSVSRYVDDINNWNKLTNGLSLSHLDRIYDPEHPELRHELEKFNNYGNRIYFQYGFYNRYNNRIGHVSRGLILEDPVYGNPFHASNLEFFLDPNYQGHGIADKIYRKQENQLFRPLANHPESYVKITANGDVGRYAWALKGFDFSDEYERDNILKDLEIYLNRHHLKKGTNADEILKSMTGRSFEDLKHTWDIAMLDDGKMHAIQSTNKPGQQGHFGKMFMIDYGSEWEGRKLLHPDSIHNKVADIWEQAKQKKRTGDLKWA